MATITGSVIYSQDSYAGIVNSAFEIKLGDEVPTGQFIQPTNNLANIPIVLWHDTEKKGITIKTGSDGKFEITDVPVGDIAVVEQFEGETSYQGSVSFQNATEMLEMPIARDPSIVYIFQLGLETYNGNKIGSLTQNTYIRTIFSQDQTITCNFIDAPMKIEAFQFPDNIFLRENSVISVDYGTIGTEQLGTPAGTSDSTCPYSQYVSGNYLPTELNSQFYDNYIKYTDLSPDDGRFTIVNIADKHNFYTNWFDVTSYKRADEQGRFMIVNGDFPNRYFFKEIVDVVENSAYVFSLWVLNIVRIKESELPSFKVTVTTLSGDVIFSESISDSNPLSVTDLPTWKQIGTFIPASTIGNNNQIVIECLSMGSNAFGNDYCIDDINFSQLKQRFITPDIEKTQVPISQSKVNEEIKYNSTLNNSTQFPLYEMMFYDELQYGTKLFENTMQFQLLNSLENELLNISIPIDSNILKDGINISEIIENNATLIINNGSFIYNQDTADQIIEGAIPVDYKLNLGYSIIVPDASVLADDCMVYNQSKFEYKTRTTNSADLIDQTIYTNITEINIDCPRISYNKSVAVIKDGVEVDLDTGDSVMCGDTIVYKITVNNPLQSAPDNYDLIDNIDSKLIPIYTLNTDCSNGISTQKTSPQLEQEVFLTCNQIENIDGNVNHIKLPNIPIPAAEEINNVLIEGTVIIRIYCKTVC